MSRPKPVTSRARRDEWELHRREISRLFLVDGVPVAQIAKYMKGEHGFDRKPKDYEYRLKKWNFRRNLHESELISIQSQLSRREQAGRRSEIVVSGIRWSESMVRGRLERHKSVWSASEQFEVDELPDSLARVQTPSPLMMGLPEWPKELPWLQFNQSIHRALATLTTASTAGQVSRPRGQDALLVQMMRFFTTEWYPKTALPVQVESINTPKRMRAMLEVIAPQVHAGDHETTADILHTGSCESLAVELIRLLVYFESNNMVDRFEKLLGFQVQLGISANMMKFLKELGFLTKANLDWLGGRTDPTGQTFLNRLLAHAIIDGNSLDVLTLLIPKHFNVNHPLKLSRQQWYGAAMRCAHNPQAEAIRGYRPKATVLSLSCFAGNVDAVRLLLDLGADPYGTSFLPNPAPLEFAASLACDERATTITSLLLSKQTRRSAQVRNAALEGPLQLAISNSNTALIMKLISERERVGGGSICSQHFTIAAKHANSATIRLLVENAPRNADGHIQLPEDILFSAMYGRYQPHPNHPGYDVCLEKVLQKFNYLLDLGVNPAVPRCRYGCVGSFCLEYLLEPEVTHPDAITDEFMLKMLEAMRKHGCPPERPKSTSKGNPGPSVLQLAIAIGYTQLVEYLLDWGADIDFLRDVSESSAPRCKDCLCIVHSYFTRGCSPLLTALEYGRTEIVKILLRHRPNLKLRGGEHLLAIRNCEPEVVSMLFAESPTDDVWKASFQQAVSMRKSKLIELLLRKNSNSLAEIDPSTITRAALVTGDYYKAYQMSTACEYDSRTLFQSVLQPHREKVCHKIVDRLLQMRPNTPNDDFEIRVVAYAAMHHDTDLLKCLMKYFGQGPWIADFPDSGSLLSEWGIDRPKNSRYRVTHILSYAAEFGEVHKDDTVLKALLQANISTKGLYIPDSRCLSEETLGLLLAAGLDPNQVGFLFTAVKENLLMHVRALCEVKVDLNALHINGQTGGNSRAAIQLAVERGSPEMLQILLHYGADVDAPAGYDGGVTCLQLAAGAGNIGLVRLLMNKGAKVNAKRSLFYGRTAVEIAAENGRLDVLKLILLQEQHLFRTPAERYQFIRAAKMAEQNGHALVGKMLRQHIHWDRGDQRLFDAMKARERFILHLDEMTQRVTESEKRGARFWRRLHRVYDEVGFYIIDNVKGIEQWIGEIPDEQLNVCEFSGSHTKFSSDGEDSVCWIDPLATAGQRAAERDEAASDLDHTSVLSPMHNNTANAIVLSEGFHVETVTKYPGNQSQALTISPGCRQVGTALAPQAIRYDNKVPAWLNMDDNMLDSADDVDFWAVEEHRSATRNLQRESGMVFCEAQELHPCNDELGGKAFASLTAEDGDRDSQHFNWGCWDEEGIFREASG